MQVLSKVGVLRGKAVSQVSATRELSFPSQALPLFAKISSCPRKMPVTTDAIDANVTNSPKFGNVNQPYRMPPDPCGSYQHSFREQSQGNQPAVVQAAQ